MDFLSKQLMLGSSVVAMIAAASATTASAQDNVENITISASRIQVQGYEAPTPVTVIGLEELRRDAKVSIGDSIRELPSVGISDSPGNGSHSGNASQGDAGMDTVNLRNLGVVRTLVLFDGQRVVTSNPNSDSPPAIGGVDLSTLPTSIIERVDVVTGGASAQWGSDAVAGVVNLVINKTFTGFKANLNVGNSQRLDHATYKAELAAGFELLGGRGHTVFAGSYTMSPDTLFGWDRQWYRPQALYPCSSVGRPGGSGTLCHVGNIGNVTRTNGGLVLNGNAFTGNAVQQAAALAAVRNIGTQYSGFAATPTNVNGLRGIQFVGQGNLQSVPFNFGITSGNTCTNCSAYNAFGGGSNLDGPPLFAVPHHNLTLFNYTSFKVTDSITASIQLNYGKSGESNTSNNGRAGNNPIRVDNAFLPESIRQSMIASSIPSITVGVSNMGALSPGNVTMAGFQQAVSQNLVQNYRQLMRGVFTLRGVANLFGEDWSWEAYAQHSAVRERQFTPYNTLRENYNNAIDAVVVTATGSNSLGGGDPATATAVRNALTAAGANVPQVGEIACRSALTTTSWGTTTNSFGYNSILPGGLFAGCVPLNILGTGNASQAALNYVAPGRVGHPAANQALYRMNQAVFSASASGTLPFGLDAGNVAVATGFEYRLEQQRNTRDPLQLGASGVWQSGNFSEFAGQYHVEEGFLEINVPVLKNQFVNSLDLSAAGRITSYSTSGMVETWKLGATSQVNQDIKLRTSLSSDIRAPGIGELFSVPLLSTSTQVPFPNAALATPATTTNLIWAGVGNAALVPEQSTTISGGIVVTPRWIENLSMSFDWYSISIHRGIFSPSQGQIYEQCGIRSNPIFCAMIFRGVGRTAAGVPVAQEVDLNGMPATGVVGALGTFPADAEGAINFYLRTPVNANNETVSGLDFQVDYSHELFEGELAYHIVGNYTDQKTRTSLGVTVNGAGAVSGDAGVNPLAGFTMPKLRSTISTTYSEDTWSLTAQARIFGSARLSNQYIEGINPGGPLPAGYSGYVDNNGVPAVAYADLRASWYMNDTMQLYGAVDNLFNAPPPIIATTGGATTDCRIYDCIGRAFRIGVRFEQ